MTLRAVNCIKFTATTTLLLKAIRQILGVFMYVNIHLRERNI